MTRIKHALCVAQVCAGAALTSAFAADVPKDRYWNLEFSGLFGGAKPLICYARDRDGRWLAAVGSSRDPATGKRAFNKSYASGDLSAAPIQGGAFKGRVVFHMTPDVWVPTDHRSFPLIMDVDAKLQSETELTGTWTLMSAVSAGFDTASLAKSGALRGKAKVAETQELPDPVTLRFNLHGAKIGGLPIVGERTIIILLGVKDGKLVSTLSADLNVGDRSYGGMDNVSAFPSEGNTLEAGRDAVKAHGVFPSRTLDLESCQYEFDLNGQIFSDMLTGTYKLVARVEGRPDVTVDGGFDGTLLKTLVEASKRQVVCVDVTDFVPVRPGEHPRLLFRKSDLPEIRKRAETPEGKAIIARLRHMLGGNGETFPSKLPEWTKGYPGPGQYDDRYAAEQGYLTLGHAAGYGLLYQLTGDKKYADLGRKCFETWMTGVRDVDSRYSFLGPNGELRAGSSWAVTALGYDLCYDGWDEAFRKKVVETFLSAKIEQGTTGLKKIVTAPNCSPAKNHYGGIICGAAAVATIVGDPGAEDPAIQRVWLPLAYENTVGMLTRGFGDHGFYSEAHGPSHVSSDTGLLLWLKAAKVACGKDFITPAPNAQWITLRWVMEIVPQGGRAQTPDRKSKAGPGYGTDSFDRMGPWSHGGQFSQGFGAVDSKYHPAMLWVYRNFLEPQELRGDFAPGYGDVFKDGWLTKGDKSYDAMRSIWHAVMAFVNWPIGVEPANPETVMPKAVEDSIHGYYTFRNRWKDGDDIVVTALLDYGPQDAYRPQSGPIYVWGYGQKFNFGYFTAGKTDLFESKPNGSGLVVAGGRQLAVDMSGASGAGVLLATIGIGTNMANNAVAEVGDVKMVSRDVTLGKQPVSVTMLVKGSAPEVKVEGEKAVAGGQTIGFDGKRIVFGK